jgi:LPXTG-motif cell wall-anchored protein
MPAGSDADCAPGTGVEGTGTETETGDTPATSGPQVKGEKVTRIAPQVLGHRATRASVLPFTGTHVDELLVAGVLLLVSGSAGILLGRRRET